MQFRDLNKQYVTHKQEIDSAIQSVLSKTDFIHGSKVVEVEEKLARYVGAKHCITCANGTDALQLALMAWEIKSGDAVFVPDFTFFSSGEVVSAVGATPIFVDVCENTFNIDSTKLEEMIERVIKENKYTPKAVIAVDLFGQPADYNSIRRVCDKYNLYLLEDGAQGFGGKVGNRYACSFGDISTTSFFPAKPLGCYGDGGAIFTDNDIWAETIRSLCVHGKGKDKYDNIRIGMNSRLDTIQAAVISEKLNFFEDEIAMCNRIAGMYSDRMKDIVDVPFVENGMRSSWAQYTIKCSSASKREEIIQSIGRRGIPTAIYYKKPMHKQAAFRGQVFYEENYSVTNSLVERCLSLPMHPYLTEEDIVDITSAISEIG